MGSFGDFGEILEQFQIVGLTRELVGSDAQGVRIRHPFCGPQPFREFLFQCAPQSMLPGAKVIQPAVSSLCGILIP